MNKDVGDTQAEQNEYAEAVPELVDNQGRQIVQTMSDRELLEEAVAYLRAFGDALGAAANSPMAMAIPGLRDMLGK